MIDNSGRFKDIAGTVIWLFPARLDQEMPRMTRKTRQVIYKVLATDQGASGKMVRLWKEAEGRILILGFRSISFLIRESFSTIVVKFSKIVKCCQL
ncbi:hypothetical protein YC2023_094394 [Brassica napus]